MTLQDFNGVPGLLLGDGRAALLVPLTFGRARICVGPAADLTFYKDGY